MSSQGVGRVLSAMYLRGGQIQQENSHFKFELICQPKNRGGLGLNKVVEMNKVLLAKLNWGLLTEQDRIWCKVTRGKYDIKQLSKVQPQLKQRVSHIWVVVIWSTDPVQRGVKW